MKELSKYTRFYFLGIGGIGMSALARYFIHKGKKVAGYDKTPSELTDQLKKEGIPIHFEDNNIPKEFNDKKNTAVIYTPAIPKDLKEYNYFLENGFYVLKRSEALSEITRGKTTIAVAGTHGKTSTCAFIAHILKAGNVPFYGFLGGIASNYKTNFFAPEKGKTPKLYLVEADEYDRSFLRLNPDRAVITAIEADHLDIYGSEKKLQEAFVEFAGKLKPEGQLFTHENLRKFNFKVRPKQKLFSYGISKEADFRAEDIHIKDGTYIFNLYYKKDLKLKNIKLGIPGIHNINNCLAAYASTEDWRAPKVDYPKALANFKGVHRRFEVVLKKKNRIFIDDYAHHPTEIRTTIETVKQMYPHKRVLGIFQPHLFSRTRDLADGFAESLSLLDELLLMPIYPAREKPIPGVSSEMILKKAILKKKRVADKNEVLQEIKKTQAQVILTIGAGDIDRLIQPIKRILLARSKN